MAFRKLFGAVRDEGAEAAPPPEIDTRISTLALRPGTEVSGRLVIRAGGADLRITDIFLQPVATMYRSDGEVITDHLTYFHAGVSRFDVPAGTERQVPVTGRLPWSVPFTDFAGRALGIDLSLRTRIVLGDDAETVLTDTDFLHVDPLPAVRAVLDAFGELGYLERYSHLVKDQIKGSEQIAEEFQPVFLTDPSGGRTDFPELELAFDTNPVGTICHLRLPAPDVFTWDAKPGTVWFPAAHHEVPYADLTARAARALEDLAEFYRRRPKKARARR
ncbi:sporulation protein [Streptomyces sp. NBC_00347]|uniref:sporulation protein n=1 Tax=Streptomyces sp. NBC_00347 TaxID=2975721 RepID=UPI002258FBA6|nr:sporulation protein [Streptomyces sp. NBC_00347]MCX5124546.1 sporulation protein [Streptomyces sp. NBC_00347]